MASRWSSRSRAASRRSTCKPFSALTSRHLFPRDVTRSVPISLETCSATSTVCATKNSMPRPLPSNGPTSTQDSAFARWEVGVRRICPTFSRRRRIVSTSYASRSPLPLNHSRSHCHCPRCLYRRLASLCRKTRFTTQTRYEFRKGPETGGIFSWAVPQRLQATWATHLPTSGEFTRSRLLPNQRLSHRMQDSLARASCYRAGR